MSPNVNTGFASKGETLGDLFFSEAQLDDKLMIIITSPQSSLRSQDSNYKALSILSCIVDTDRLSYY